MRMLYIIDSVGIVDSNVLKTALIGITYLSTNKLEVATLLFNHASMHDYMYV